MSFSHRKGFKKLEKVLQLKDMDSELRNGLWNVLQLSYWDRFSSKVAGSYIKHSNLDSLFQKYWHLYFKLPLDQMPAYFKDALREIRQYFFSCKWYEVYDFIEFTLQSTPIGDNSTKMFFSFNCNEILERENSAYRFVGEVITEITSKDEIESIEDALKKTSKLSGIYEHLSKSLELLSDRKNPDYRNSIKESISAVEGICKILANDSHASLGEALKIIEQKQPLHTALKKSFSSLYGYTSDADGIRHAMLEDSRLTFVDAKYMLVTCTAFINYMLGKASELYINRKTLIV